MASGSFNWGGGSWSITLTSSLYTPNYETHTTYNDIPSGARLIPSPVAIVAHAPVNGYCTADNYHFASLDTSGVPVTGVVLLNAAQSNELVAFFDNGSGFSIIGLGGAAFINWASAGMFRP
jgi:hypothetical protein